MTKLTFKEIRFILRWVSIGMSMIAVSQSDLMLALKWFIASSIINDVEFELWDEE